MVYNLIKVHKNLEGEFFKLNQNFLSRKDTNINMPNIEVQIIVIRIPFLHW